MSNEVTMKFYDAYQRLEKIANEMRESPEKVIDVMEEKLKEAIDLNKFCNERLKKVQNMLDKYKVEAEIATESEAENKPFIKEKTDDDIPF